MPTQKQKEVNENKILVTAHIAYHPISGQPAAGPFSSITTALIKLGYRVNTVLIPLCGWEKPAQIEFYGDSKKQVRVAKFLGKNIAIKYLTDIVVETILIIQLIARRGVTITIGCDALATLPLLLIKKIIPLKVIFYCVDFNQQRFNNKLLQWVYQKSDFLCSKYSDQVWVVGYSLLKDKKERYGIIAHYIPNSFPFDKKVQEETIQERNGNRVVWTGSLSTDRQLNALIQTIKGLLFLRPELEINLIPANYISTIEQAIVSNELSDKVFIHQVPSQHESQQIVKTMDLGLAIYDEKFGSTAYIEPIKIWEYLLCGIPFIISKEPVICPEIMERGVAFKLDAANSIPKDDSLRTFISKEHITQLPPTCIALAKKYSLEGLVSKQLSQYVK